MLKRKWLALVIVLIMGLGTLTGCSPNELGYYNLSLEAGSQKVYTETGSIELTLDQLPASLFTGETALSEEVVKKAFDQHQLEYTGKVDINQNIFQYEFTVINKVSGATSPVMTIVYKNNILYVKVDDLISYLQQFCDPTEKQSMDQVFADVDWISISDQELNTMIPGASQAGLTTNLLQRSSQQRMTYKRLLDDLLNEVYNDYSSNLVSKNNNQYIFTLQGAQLINVMKPVAVYSINNIDKLGAVLKTFLNSLSPAEMADLGLTEEMKEQALQGIDLMVPAIIQNRSQYLSELEKISAESQEQLINAVNDSELVATLEKIDADTYATSSKLHVNITVEDPSDKINFTLTAQDTIKAGGTVSVSAPTSGIITLTGLNQRLPRQMTVNIDSGDYSYNNGLLNNQGNISVELINGSTYLPLRQIAETMGENVGWDQSSKQAYVERDGQNIYLTSILLNDQAFIKIREFEQLGYRINWLESTRTVEISK